MSTEEHDRLLAQLRVWCRQDRGRQSALANKLDISRQLVSAWLTGQRTMSLDEWFQVEAIIKQSGGAQFSKSETMKSELVDPPTMPRESTRDPNEPRTLHSALEVIADLRAELASAKAAPNLQTLPPKPPAVAPPPPVPAVKPVPPSAATVNTFADLSTDDLLANLKEARAWGDADRVSLLQAELESRVVIRSSNKRSDTLAFDAKDPKTWTGKIGATAFPATCDNPKAIGEYLSGLSTQSLRSHLKGSPANETEGLQQKLTLAELQKRKSSR